MVIGVGHGIAIPQHLRLCQLPDKDGMGAGIHLLDYPGLEIGQHMIDQVGETVPGQLVRDPFELVHVPPGLEAELADEGEGSILGQH